MATLTSSAALKHLVTFCWSIRYSCPQPAKNTPAFVIELAPDGKGIAFSTLLGNPFFNTGNGMAVDSTGDIYVIGTTGYGGGLNVTADFPTVRAFHLERINKSF